MGAYRHGQEGALAPSGNAVKSFCALIFIAKRSVDELFMHYFHNLLSASGGSPRSPLGPLPRTPLEDYRFQTPYFAHPWKISCGSAWLGLLLLFNLCKKYLSICWVLRALDNFNAICIQWWSFSDTIFPLMAPNIFVYPPVSGTTECPSSSVSSSCS